MKVMRLSVLVLTLIAAACGTDPVDDTTKGEGGGGNGGTTNAVPTLPGSIPDLPGLSNECEALAGFFLGVAQLNLGDVANGSSLLDSSTSDMPGSLQDDVDLVAAAASAYGLVFEQLGIDLNDPQSLANTTQEQQDQLNQAAEGMSAPEVEQALDNILAYGVAECDNFGG